MIQQFDLAMIIIACYFCALHIMLYSGDPKTVHVQLSNGRRDWVLMVYFCRPFQKKTFSALPFANWTTTVQTIQKQDILAANLDFTIPNLIFKMFGFRMFPFFKLSDFRSPLLKSEIQNIWNLIFLKVGFQMVWFSNGGL